MNVSESGSNQTLRLATILIISGLLIGVSLGLVIFVGLPEGFGGAPSVTEGGDPSGGPEVGLTVGNVPPSFALTDAATGQEISLEELQGQPVLINFWATWCGPCRIEMPFLEQAYQQHQDDGFVVLAVDFDESQQAVSAFGEELGLSFPLLLDPGGETQDLYRIRAYPSTFFVAPDGTIASIHLGVMTEGQLEENLALILP